MRLAMPASGTAPKRLTNEEVTETLRSLDESVRKLENVVLRGDKSQAETPRKTDQSDKK